MENFVKTNLIFTLEDHFYPGLVRGKPLLINLGYNSKLTQNENAFKSIARNLMGNGSVNMLIL